MGSYIILLLLGLGIALATAKSLENTSPPPKVSSAKVPEITEFFSPALQEDSSIPPINEDGKHLRCNPVYDVYCANHYANGNCDLGCNSDECNWDGLDCDQSPPKVIDGTIRVVVLVDQEVFKPVVVIFLRELGHILKKLFVLKPMKMKNEMIYLWSGTGSYLGGGTTVYLEIDNRQWKKVHNKECFLNVEAAAQFLAATAIKHDLSPSFSIHEVNGIDVVPSVDGEILYSNFTS